MAFMQYAVNDPCPACGGAHQADLTLAVIERQPDLFNAVFTCPRAGREVLLAAEPTGRKYNRGGRLMLQREQNILATLLGTR